MNLMTLFPQSLSPLKGPGMHTVFQFKDVKKERAVIDNSGSLGFWGMSQLNSPVSAGFPKYRL